MNKPTQFILAIFGTIFIMMLSGQTPMIIPGMDVPITWQSMICILLPLVFPRWSAAIGLVAFVILGALGLPIFALASGGMEVLDSSSGGYILGFILVAVIATFFHSNTRESSFLRDLLLFAILQFFLLAIGAMWIYTNNYNEVTVQTHFFPFIPGLIVKSVFGAAIVRMVKMIRLDHFESLE